MQYYTILTDIQQKQNKIRIKRKKRVFSSVDIGNMWGFQQVFVGICDG